MINLNMCLGLRLQTTLIPRKVVLRLTCKAFSHQMNVWKLLLNLWVLLFYMVTHSGGIEVYILTVPFENFSRCSVSANRQFAKARDAQGHPRVAPFAIPRINTSTQHPVLAGIVLLCWSLLSPTFMPSHHLYRGVFNIFTARATGKVPVGQMGPVCPWASLSKVEWHIVMLLTPSRLNNPTCLFSSFNELFLDWPFNRM